MYACHFRLLQWLLTFILFPGRLSFFHCFSSWSLELHDGKNGVNTTKERERGGREREIVREREGGKEGERERERERDLFSCLFLF